MLGRLGFWGAMRLTSPHQSAALGSVKPGRLRLLEIGDGGDLAQLFSKIQPPVFCHNAVELWYHLVELSVTVRHSFKTISIVYSWLDEKIR